MVTNLRPPEANWYMRLNGASNRQMASLFRICARGLDMLGTKLPTSPGARCRNWAQLLTNAGHLLQEPEAARRVSQPAFLGKLLLDCLLLFVPLTFAMIWGIFDHMATVSHEHGKTVLTVSVSLWWLLGVVIVLEVLALLFLLAAQILFLSGDLYTKGRDEMQRLSAQAASAATLRVVCVGIGLLFLLYLFVPQSVLLAYLHLALLLFGARLFYIFNLLHLRWGELAAVDLEEGESSCDA
ncbi:hypothetical protein [Ktedonospora formicarum]|uniref:Uncharacterized protein n=1 Tax=Ktedonospora formicarum TaxID=2778364 RepID=A0A8J3MUS0_9CHLR|nr:hypothetical protein [Ktedonospora formicarum]GHO45695.1 hypothetical protein KSX_38580 [Ktedonospora formicarum]